LPVFLIFHYDYYHIIKAEGGRRKAEGKKEEAPQP